MEDFVRIDGLDFKRFRVGNLLYYIENRVTSEGLGRIQGVGIVSEKADGSYEFITIYEERIVEFFDPSNENPAFVRGIPLNDDLLALLGYPPKKVETLPQSGVVPIYLHELQNLHKFVHRREMDISAILALESFKDFPQGN